MHRTFGTDIPILSLTCCSNINALMLTNINYERNIDDRFSFQPSASGVIEFKSKEPLKYDQQVNEKRKVGGSAGVDGLVLLMKV